MMPSLANILGEFACQARPAADGDDNDQKQPKFHILVPERLQLLKLTDLRWQPCPASVGDKLRQGSILFFGFVDYRQSGDKPASFGSAQDGFGGNDKLC